MHLISGKCHILTGSSQKSMRISHSTSHAETLSAAKGIPLAQIVALRLCEPEIVMRAAPQLPPHRAMLFAQDEGLCAVPVDSFVDCMDLWDLCCGNRGMPQDKSQRLGVLAIREERRTLRLRRLYHVRTECMLSDMLTKSSGVDSRSLLELLSSGYWTVYCIVRVRQGFGLPAKPAPSWLPQSPND